MAKTLGKLAKNLGKTIKKPMKDENHPIDEQEECSMPDKVKRDAYLHWYHLANCEDIEALPSSTRKYLKCVAKDFMAADLSSGTASELGLKLLEVLGFETWQKLRDDSNIPKDIEEINQLKTMIATKFDGVLHRYRESSHGTDSKVARYKRLRQKHKLSIQPKSGFICIEQLMRDYDETSIEKYYAQQAILKIWNALNRKKGRKL